ncbi:MAG: lysophospholipid acyltransferase family protein [Oscillospiraceae bacterium]|nr:lysophospholipid acyltransferase family protein [Oscillospiraceae bacterium]
MIFFRIMRAILNPVAHLIFRLSCEGRDNIPATGAVVIASNHINLIDPGLHAFCIRRTFRTMAKAELFRTKVLAFILRPLGAFPVTRGKADKRSFTTAADVLRAGDALLIFPEGTRSKDGSLGLFKAGAVALCAMTGAPVVPAAMVERKHLRLFDPVKIIYGQPMSCEQLGLAGETNSRLLRHAAEMVRAEVERLAAQGSGQ